MVVLSKELLVCTFNGCRSAWPVTLILIVFIVICQPWFKKFTMSVKVGLECQYFPTSRIGHRELQAKHIHRPHCFAYCIPQREFQVCCCSLWPQWTTVGCIPFYYEVLMYMSLIIQGFVWECLGKYDITAKETTAHLTISCWPCSCLKWFCFPIKARLYTICQLWRQLFLDLKMKSSHNILCYWPIAVSYTHLTLPTIYSV